ncbi:UNVERIFIED_CONTAM: hypothetical protein FKN15_015470 [Acipenser sinensis]
MCRLLEAERAGLTEEPEFDKSDELLIQRGDPGDRGETHGHLKQERKDQRQQKTGFYRFDLQPPLQNARMSSKESVKQ